MSAIPMTFPSVSSPAGRRPAQRCRMAPVADPAQLPDLLRTMGIFGDSLTDEDRRMAIPMWQLRADAALFREGGEADSLYIVRTGSLKCTKSSEDGYDQVLSFAGPGDVLGFEGLHRGRQHTSAVALELTVVFALPLHELDAMRWRSRALDHALQFGISRQLARAGETAGLMAAVAADTRLARFLVWLSTHADERGRPSRHIVLHMGRRDIASLLGVAHETVSRSFSSLAEAGCVRVHNREVEILDADGLRARARCTRGWVEDTWAAGAAHGSRARMQPHDTGVPVAPSRAAPWCAGLAAQVR
jgi:CRP/FNR family transcriptional regulator